MRIWGIQAAFLLLICLTACPGWNYEKSAKRRKSLADEVFSYLDNSRAIQAAFYPRTAAKTNSPNAENLDIEVAPGVSLGARLFYFQPDRPSLLFFHGNGEVVTDYDQIAGIFHQVGLNLFVVDYRGYGWSGGRPTFRSLYEDSFKAADYFLKKIGKGPRPFLMGRSLGSGPATLLAVKRPGDFAGLILESGFADPLLLFERLGFVYERDKNKARELMSNELMMKKLKLPVLFLHGEKDVLIPATNARTNYEAVSHNRKTLKILPGVGHNDIMLRTQDYFQAIDLFTREAGKGKTD